VHYRLLPFSFCKLTYLAQICSKNVYYLVMPVTVLNWNTFHISTFCVAMVRVAWQICSCYKDVSFCLSQSSDTENMINYTFCYQFCPLSRSVKSLIFQLHQSQHHIEEICGLTQDTYSFRPNTFSRVLPVTHYRDIVLPSSRITVVSWLCAWEI
jgi:hypothetical protein